MSFNHKRRSPSSPCLLYCCFHDGHAAVCHEASSDCDNGNRYKAVRLPHSWQLSTAQELPLSEIRYKCWRIITQIGRCRRQGHFMAREFGYDPMSYALNFEDNRSRSQTRISFPGEELLGRAAGVSGSAVAGEVAEGSRSV